MGNFLIFAINRISFRISNFIRHWYFTSFQIYAGFIVSLLEKFDKFFAFKITRRNLFKPLYQDSSIIGYVLGFFFRFWRLVFGGVFYAVFLALALAAFVGWSAIPIFIFYKIIGYSPVIQLLK
ncbi:MAG: hypothetical protein AAB757_00615 [Patescibacteria group bacterium]